MHIHHPRPRGKRRRLRRKGEKGASLVEFAFVLPLLLLLILGMIEFGFLFAQYNEIRHGAREGARYAAVSRPDYNGDTAVGDEDDVLAVTCDSINLPNVSMEISLSYDDADASGTPDRLEYGTLTVDADTSSLSGVPLVSWLIPDSLSNSASFRLEQDAAWVAMAAVACP